MLTNLSKDNHRAAIAVEDPSSFAWVGAIFVKVTIEKKHLYEVF